MKFIYFDINDDLVFELELIKQIEVNIDYILKLIEEYAKSNCKDKEILVSISKAIDSSLILRSKKELIEGFIETINIQGDSTEWHDYIQQHKESDLTDLINTEKLNNDKTRMFLNQALKDGLINVYTGTIINEIMPPVSLFNRNRNSIKDKVQNLLLDFFEKYSGL